MAVLPNNQLPTSDDDTSSVNGLDLIPLKSEFDEFIGWKFKAQTDLNFSSSIDDTGNSTAPDKVRSARVQALIDEQIEESGYAPEWPLVSPFGRTTGSDGVVYKLVDDAVDEDHGTTARASVVNPNHGDVTVDNGQGYRYDQSLALHDWVAWNGTDPIEPHPGINPTANVSSWKPDNVKSWVEMAPSEDLPIEPHHEVVYVNNGSPAIRSFVTQTFRGRKITIVAQNTPLTLDHMDVAATGIPLQLWTEESLTLGTGESATFIFLPSGIPHRFVQTDRDAARTFDHESPKAMSGIAINRQLYRPKWPIVSSAGRTEGSDGLAYNLAADAKNIDYGIQTALSDVVNPVHGDVMRLGNLDLRYDEDRDPIVWVAFDPLVDVVPPYAGLDPTAGVSSWKVETPVIVGRWISEGASITAGENVGINTDAATDTGSVTVDSVVYTGAQVSLLAGTGINEITFVQLEGDNGAIITGRINDVVAAEFYIAPGGSATFLWNATEQFFYTATDEDGYPEVIDSLDSDSTTQPLSANMGKVLKEQIDTLPQVVNSIAELRDVDPTVSTVVQIKHSTQGGVFFWEATNHATKVAVDPLRMYYVPPTDQTGGPGAWVRQWNKATAIAEWGDVGTDWNQVMVAARTTALLFPGVQLALLGDLYTKDSSSDYPANDSRGVRPVISGISVIGKGIGKTVIRQGYATSEPLVAFGVDNETNSTGKISNVTIDGASLHIGSLVQGTSAVNTVIEDVRVIGWRNGIEFFSDTTTGRTEGTRLRRVLIDQPGTNGQVYPLRFNAVWGTPRIYDTLLEDVIVIGSGGHYSGVSTAGTADQISFQNCLKVRLYRCWSQDSGELDYNFSRFTEDVIGDDLTAINADADGVNIGSGQLKATVADVTGFVAAPAAGPHSEVLINGLITGRIQYIEGNDLFIASAGFGNSPTLPVIGHTVVGTQGGSSTLSAWKASAHNVKLTNVRAYGNGRDEAVTGADYAGIKLNMASNVMINGANVSSSSSGPQKYGIGAVNAIWTYSDVNAEGNVIQGIHETGRINRYILNSTLVPAEGVALTKGSNANLDAAGAFVMNGTGRRQVKPNGSLTYQAITDITGAIDGEIITLSTNTAASTVAIEPNSRMLVPAGLTMRSIQDSVTLIYSDSGSGYWSLLSDGIEHLNRKSFAELVVANTTSETTLISETMPKYTMGLVDVVLGGEILNDSGATATATVRVKIGGTTVFTTTSNALASGAQGRSALLDFSVSKTKINGRYAIGPNNKATAGTTDEINVNQVFRETYTVDETVDQTFEVTVELSAADSALTFTRDVYTVVSK